MSGRWTQYGVQGLETSGVDVRSLCRESGLDYDEFTDPTAWVEHATFTGLWSQAVRATGSADLGLHAAERFKPAARDLLTHLLMSCPTLGDGMKRTTRFYELSGDPIGPKFVARPNENVFKLADRPHEHSAWAEFRLGIYMRFGEMALQQQIQPLEVRFRHADRGASRQLYARVFRCSPRFSASETCFVVTDETLDLPLPSASEDVALTLEKAALVAVRDQTSSTLESRVRSMIRSAMPDGDCSESAIATALHISVRTLKRRLAEVQCSFSDLVDDVRMKVALDLLVSTKASLDHIAHDVGYSSPGSLVRAMKRWTGHTPAAFRAAQPGLRKNA